MTSTGATRLAETAHPPGPPPVGSPAPDRGAAALEPPPGAGRGGQLRNLLDEGRNSYNCCMKAVVSEKGQVTIPKKLRDRLGIRPGQLLEFDEEGGNLVARKATLQDPVDAVYGIIDLSSSTDAFVAELRGEVESQ